MQLKKRYTFNTRSPSVLGLTHHHSLLTGIVDFNTVKDRYNILEKYQIIKPELPAVNAGVALTEDTYYVFEDSEGVSFCLAESWIDMDTMTEDTGSVMTIVIKDIDAVSKQVIMDSIRLLNLTNVAITEE